MGPGSAAHRQGTLLCVRATRELPRTLSPHRHCERSEAIQSLSAAAVWIASLRSQWRNRCSSRPSS